MWIITGEDRMIEHQHGHPMSVLQHLRSWRTRIIRICFQKASLSRLQSWNHAKCPTFINKDPWSGNLRNQQKKMSLSYPSVILSSIHFSSILSAKTCANVAGSDHFGPSCCLVQIQAASQVITETSLTEKHNTAHLSRKLRMFPGWFFFAKKKT